MLKCKSPQELLLAAKASQNHKISGWPSGSGDDTWFWVVYGLVDNEHLIIIGEGTTIGTKAKAGLEAQRKSTELVLMALMVDALKKHFTLQAQAEQN